MRQLLFLGALLAGLSVSGGAAPAVERASPSPLPGHPGNVFLAGAEVVLTAPPGPVGPWRLLDYNGKILASLTAKEGRFALGRLPVGYYTVQGETGGISLAVLAPLSAPTSKGSPIALDVAMAWFYPKEKMAEVANLCALAGVNRVRDRLLWGEMEPARGQFAAATRYDEAARAQSRAGLEVLQVMHRSPDWAARVNSRFPPDLRDAHNFFREMAARWRGQVAAFEPWNEADIPNFGGHTGSEMASLQKACWLGLKAGNPDVIACLNVFALPNRAILEDLRDNEAWPYFDTFNLHHYAPFENYPQLYADFRAVSAGRPLWVSECALPVKWAGDPERQEPTEADSRVLAERVPKVFACSLHEGSAATFYFLLPHYVEGQTQFGLLKKDLTPRPGYVALAAVGRLLADASPLGRLKPVPESARSFLFSACPDGHPAVVLVAWASNGEADLSLPLSPTGLFDHLGRERSPVSNLRLSAAPVFAVFSRDATRQFNLEPPPATPPRLVGEPSPVVLQALWPDDSLVLSHSASRLSSRQEARIPVFVYNFGGTPVTGRLAVTVPPGWQAGSFPELTLLAPQSRTELTLNLNCREAVSAKLTEVVRITGDFGPAGRPVLSFRIMPDPPLLVRQAGVPLAGADDPARWQPTVSGNGEATLTRRDGALLIDAAPQTTDKWVYPRLPLPKANRPPPGAAGLCCRLRPLEGDGQFRAIFEEENGSQYVVDFISRPEPGETTEVLALFEAAAFGAGWSPPDPNRRLDPAEIVSVKIGCNARTDRVRFSVDKIRWVKP